MPEALDYPTLALQGLAWAACVAVLVSCVAAEWRDRRRPTSARGHALARRGRRDVERLTRCDWCGLPARCRPAADVLNPALGTLVPTQACDGCRTVLAPAVVRAIPSTRSW